MDSDKDRARDAREREGGERGEGRPSGMTESTRPGAEGRPAEVRHADATTRPDADSAPTEDVVERGGTPDTEHQPGGDL
ncbi:MAG TPA: hypothetical protein VFS32_13220 [Candidatus Limnocylindrales bacterium]|nr:hypothetical protein [Candidatus Limnocylindrales bacterium]